MHKQRKGVSIKFKVALAAIISITVLTLAIVAFGYQLFESNVMENYGKYATTVLEYAYRVTEDYEFCDMIREREMPEGYGLGCIENDCAIVWPAQGEPYILVTLSSELAGRNDEAIQIIRQISAYVAAWKAE